MTLLRSLIVFALAVVLAVVCGGCFQAGPVKKKLPRRIVIPVRPIPPNRPAPRPPRPCPGPWCPRELLSLSAGGAIGGRVSPDGVPLMIDYPGDRMQKNLEGTDGAGLCVFAATAWALDWHGDRDGPGFLPWMTSKPGGGWPAKLSAMLTEYYREKGRQPPEIVQMEGTDLGFVQRSLAQGKMVCAWYGYSPTGRYQGKRISHWVNVLHHDGQRVAIGDNNFPDSDRIEWLSVAEWEKCTMQPSGKTWAAAFTLPPPPPVPHNRKDGE